MKLCSICLTLLTDILIIISLCLSPVLLLSQTTQASPPFPRQFMLDDQNDWQPFSVLPNSNCTNILNTIQIPDMTGVTYFSDGKFLNATIWLSGPFKEVPKPEIRPAIYGMNIGIVQSNNMTVNVDYTTSVHWNISNHAWSIATDELLANDRRTLWEDDNYTGFFDNTGNKGHVSLSLDLKGVSHPSQFALIFYMIDVIITKGNVCGIVDVANNAVYIPPPEFSVSAFPNPLEIRQGETETIELKVNSTTPITFTQPSAILSVGLAPDGIEIDPNEISLPSANIPSSHLDVKVSNTVKPASYTLPIHSNISFPITVDLDPFLSSFNTTLPKGSPLRLMGSFNTTLPKGSPLSNITLSTISPIPVDFDVIVKPYPIEEKFKDFWNTYGGPIGLIAGGFAAGLSALLIDKLKRRSKQKSK
jgi:hypothetical protein